MIRTTDDWQCTASSVHPPIQGDSAPYQNSGQAKITIPCILIEALSLSVFFTWWAQAFLLRRLSPSLGSSSQTLDRPR